MSLCRFYSTLIYLLQKTMHQQLLLVLLLPSRSRQTSCRMIRIPLQRKISSQFIVLLKQSSGSDPQRDVHLHSLVCTNFLYTVAAKRLILVLKYRPQLAYTMRFIFPNRGSLSNGIGGLYGSSVGPLHRNAFTYAQGP